MPLTTNVVSSNLDLGEVYNIYYVIKLVSDLRQVGGFLWVLRLTLPIKTDCHDITKILLKVALNTIKQTNKQTNIKCSSFHTPAQVQRSGMSHVSLLFLSGFSYPNKSSIHDIAEKLMKVKINTI